MRKIFAAVFAVALLIGGLAMSRPAHAVTSDPVYTGTYDFVTLDNGMQGTWATDTFHSTVKIYDEGEGQYRVVREDGGSFVTLDGAQSPGGQEGSPAMAGGIQGTISGGETTIIHGTLKADLPDHVGPIDYTEHSRPIPYYEPFFETENARGSVVEWGWTYSTCNNGTWTDNDASEAAYSADGPNDVMGNVSGIYEPCATPVSSGNGGSAPTFAASSTEAHPPVCNGVYADKPLLQHFLRLDPTTVELGWWPVANADRYSLVYGYVGEGMNMGVVDIAKNVTRFNVGLLRPSTAIQAQLWAWRGECVTVSDIVDP